MGYYPHQDFVYGVCIDYEGGLYDVCEAAGFDLAFGPEGSGIAVVGFELDTNKVVENGYVGGNWVTKFKKDYFDEWLTDAIERMTPEKVRQLQELVGVTDAPALWTVSRMG